jgi:hypothetical protein
LPLCGTSSSIVWTESKLTAQRIFQLLDAVVGTISQWTLFHLGKDVCRRSFDADKAVKLLFDQNFQRFRPLFQCVCSPSFGAAHTTGRADL